MPEKVLKVALNASPFKTLNRFETQRNIFANISFFGCYTIRCRKRIQFIHMTFSSPLNYSHIYQLDTILHSFKLAHPVHDKSTLNLSYANIRYHNT